MQKFMLGLLLAFTTSTFAAPLSSQEAIVSNGHSVLARLPGISDICANAENRGECFREFGAQLDEQLAQIMGRIEKALRAEIVNDGAQKYNKFFMPDEAVAQVKKAEKAWKAFMEAQCGVDDAIYLTNGIGNRPDCEYRMKGDRLNYLINKAIELEAP